MMELRGFILASENDNKNTSAAISQFALPSNFFISFELRDV